MTITSIDILNSVVRGHAASTCEADWRGTCSRSYYSIYEDGKEFYANLPIPGFVRSESIGGLHQDLIERLSNPGSPRSDPNTLKSRQVGALMATLHAKRIKADYKRPLAMTMQDAADSVAHATAVQKLLFTAAPASAGPAVATPALTKGSRPTLTRIK